MAETDHFDHQNNVKNHTKFNTNQPQQQQNYHNQSNNGYNHRYHHRNHNFNNNMNHVYANNNYTGNNSIFWRKKENGNNAYFTPQQLRPNKKRKTMQPQQQQQQGNVENEIKNKVIDPMDTDQKDNNQQSNMYATMPRIKFECDLLTKPLYLVCLRLNHQWSTMINDIERRSFGGYRPNPFKSHELELWKKLITQSKELKWCRPKLPNGRNLPRKAVWLVSSSQCRCSYRYSSTLWKPVIYPMWFEKITQRVLKETGLHFEYIPNSCNINWYEDGSDSVGWHSDDEWMFNSMNDDCLILSLSLGAERRFEIKLIKNGKDDDMEEEDITHIMLKNGDLMTMEGMFQKYYVHRVPKEKNVEKERINLTWRWIRQHNFYRDHCRLYIDRGPGIVFPT